jgi:hypothetical protein
MYLSSKKCYFFQVPVKSTKKFVCNHCDKQYTRKGNLKTHMLTHKGKQQQKKNFKLKLKNTIANNNKQEKTQ